MPASFATSPPAEAALFNPAFVGLLIASAANGFRSVAGSGMPCELLFLVPPIALHQDTRAALPGNTNGRMSSWTIENPVVVSEFGSRARAMTPLVRESLRYMLRAGAVRLVGGTLVSRLPAHPNTGFATQDVQACVSAASFAGRWFAKTGDSGTIYALLGVRP
jgi:hypothetical protein